MKKILFLILVISTSVFANVSIKKVDVDICIDTTKYSNKSFKEMKEIIVGNIQEVAFNKFFNDKTSADYKGELTKTHRDELSVEVKDMYDNGTNFCNKATVSIEDEKINYFLPQKISLDRVCFKDENLSPEKLKEKAEAKAYKEIISQVSQIEISEKEAQSLIMNYEKKDGKMYMAKSAYCLSASGDVIPFEIDTLLSEKSDNTANKNTNILKNKMSMLVQSRKAAYKEEFYIDYSNNGIQISQNEFDLMNLAYNNDSVMVTFSAKILVPNNIQDNTVELSISGEPKFVSSGWDYRYFTFINGEKINNKNQNVKVINENGQRYINLDIKSYFHQNSVDGFINYVIPRLSSLIFNINSNSKIIPVIIKPNISVPIIIKHKSNNKIKKFDVTYNKEIFNFNKEQLFYIKNSLNNDSLSFKFSTKLLIPDEIKDKTIVFSISEPKFVSSGWDYRYFTFINGEKINNKNQNVKVLNENGIRYINLEIESYTSKNNFEAFTDHIIRRLNIMNFMVSSNNNEKWYSLIPYVKDKIGGNKPSYFVNSISEVF